jgi:hypothetical protein
MVIMAAITTLAASPLFDLVYGRRAMHVPVAAVETVALK